MATIEYEFNKNEAFPRSVAVTPIGSVVHGNPGMTLRDYFAAKVIQGFIAGSMADGSELDVAGAPIIAKMAFMVADAMLAERAK